MPAQVVVRMKDETYGDMRLVLVDCVPKLEQCTGIDRLGIDRWVDIDQDDEATVWRATNLLMHALVDLTLTRGSSSQG